MLVVKPKARRPLERPSIDRRIILKWIVLNEVKLENVDWIYLA
jgi:hypothetical protein